VTYLKLIKFNATNMIESFINDADVFAAICYQRSAVLIRVHGNPLLIGEV
jgi:hypothetical protein